MANKDEYQRRLRAAMAELTAAHVALLQVDGDKAKFTFADVMADKLLDIDHSLQHYHNVVDQISLDTEVHV
ncbi:hypothetical protein JAO78_005275 [Alishewanella sp. 16-MA]|uniref:Uncharacterized protein n=1 Tax=Alishewanella maricola TaxID=2795740 RepID=A0ABS8C1P6_9ALTE|nr:hypothetical protein [Alishewanella maricola]MCB5226223.1 hypothetical protein [Alishewanella maricola]